MKAKYYPHVTILGLAMMFVVPLCFVLSLPYLRSSQDSLGADFADAIIDGAIEDQKAIAADNSETKSAVPSRDETTQTTRVAMLPPKPAAPTMEYAMPKPAVMNLDDASAVSDMAAIENDSVEEMASVLESAVPLPPETPPSAVAPAVPDATRPSMDVAAAGESMTAQKNTEADDVFVEPQVVTGSYFESTSHLAMKNSLGASTGRTSAATSSPRAADGLITRRMSKAEEQKMRQEMDAMTSIATDALPKDDGFGVSPEAVVVDVMLQQPLESRMVSRMENVVAVTEAKGWPIALVRSDLPDDYWWVQQMVGIRGNAFAARVNFGNENSIRGSVYHLVFVFLDSPDEVRRFRIAKQFKKLPEGTRRSREYTFTRK